MPGKIYLHLLILCGILGQGIFATLSDEDTRKSSDLLTRKRRVISHFPEERFAINIQQAKYILNIKEYNRLHCVGVILSNHIALTAATCVRHDESSYKVYSGNNYVTPSNMHNITSKLVYSGNPPYETLDGIAVISVNPPFVFSNKVGRIDLFTGFLPPGTMVTVYGWGICYQLQPGPNSRAVLRSIRLPIMNHAECQNIYNRNHIYVTEKHLCTYHAQQYCAYSDIGAPLVFNNQLAGIHVWKGEFNNQRNPDVFINLQRSEYREWIRERLLL